MLSLIQHLICTWLDNNLRDILELNSNKKNQYTKKQSLNKCMIRSMNFFTSSTKHKTSNIPSLLQYSIDFTLAWLVQLDNFQDDYPNEMLNPWPEKVAIIFSGWFFCTTWYFKLSFIVNKSMCLLRSVNHSLAYAWLKRKSSLGKDEK